MWSDAVRTHLLSLSSEKCLYKHSSLPWTNTMTLHFYCPASRTENSNTGTLLKSLQCRALPASPLLHCKCYRLRGIVAWKFFTLVRDNWPPVAALLCLEAQYKQITTIIYCQWHGSFSYSVMTGKHMDVKQAAHRWRVNRGAIGVVCAACFPPRGKI